jgi:TonB family protein
MSHVLSSLLWFSLGLLVVLGLRRPARRLFGAAPAFGLWLLPPLLAIAAWLPTTWPHATPALAIPMPAFLVAAGTNGATATGHDWLTWLWLAGAALLTVRIAWRCLELRSAWRQPSLSLLRALRDAGLTRRQRRSVRVHPAGPAALWLGRTWLLLPADFPDRFDAGQRALVLRHERMHLRRGDPLWRLLAEAAAIALWFHPLVWLALPRFRLDQELACDEAVLRGDPASRVRYAQALFRGAVGATALPTLTSWLDEPQLKERLTMIHTHRHGALRRRSGYLALTALLGGGALVAQAAAPQAGIAARATTEAARQAEVVQRMPPPRYPADAIKNKHEGEVILDILVATDGSPKAIKINRSSGHSELDRAALEAATRWSYSPAMEDGQASEGWAEVPITFSLQQF